VRHERQTGNKAAGAADDDRAGGRGLHGVLHSALNLAGGVLALTGGSIAVSTMPMAGHENYAIAVVVCTWSWIAWQRWRTGRRIARLAAALMILATLLTATRPAGR